MDYTREINECYDIICRSTNLLPLKFSSSELKTLDIINKKTQQPHSISSLILEYALPVLRPHQVSLVDSDAIRNTFLLAAITNNKPLFDTVTPRKHSLIYTYKVKHTNPEMRFFKRFGLMLQPSNDFIQTLHNVLCYEGLSYWLDQFMRDESSAITGTYYLAAGKGNVYEIKRNVTLYGRRINRKAVLNFAILHRKHPDDLSFLTNDIMPRYYN